MLLKVRFALCNNVGLHEQFYWRRAGLMLLFSCRNMSFLCLLWHDAFCRRIVHWWGASCTLGVFLECRRASNSVGVLLGVKKGLDMCGSSLWSEEGPRVVREFFVEWRRASSCEGVLLGVLRTSDSVLLCLVWGPVLLEREDVMCDSCNIFPEFLKIVGSPAPI